MYRAKRVGATVLHRALAHWRWRLNLLRRKAGCTNLRDNTVMSTRFPTFHQPSLCVTKTLARQTRHYRISG